VVSAFTCKLGFFVISLSTINQQLSDYSIQKDIINLKVKKIALSSLHLEFEISIKISFFVNDNAKKIMYKLFKAIKTEQFSLLSS